jgi:hypothetical protein
MPSARQITQVLNAAGLKQLLRESSIWKRFSLGFQDHVFCKFSIRRHLSQERSIERANTW